MDSLEHSAAYHLMVCKATHWRTVAAVKARGERLSGDRSGKYLPRQISITLNDTVSSPGGTVFITSGGIITTIGAALGMRFAGEDAIDCCRHWLEAPESHQAAKSD